MKTEYYPSLKIELGKVSYYIQKLLSEVLGRKFVCSTKVESTDYWCIYLVVDRCCKLEDYGFCICRWHRYGVDFQCMRF